MELTIPARSADRVGMAKDGGGGGRYRGSTLPPYTYLHLLSLARYIIKYLSLLISTLYLENAFYYSDRKIKFFAFLFFHVRQESNKSKRR